MCDIIQILQDAARRDIESKEDQKFINFLIALRNVENLGKALSEIPNTRWKKFKYHIKNLFGLIKEI